MIREELNDKHLATGFKEILQKYKEINHIADTDKMVGGKE